MIPSLASWGEGALGRLERQEFPVSLVESHKNVTGADPPTADADEEARLAARAAKFTAARNQEAMEKQAAAIHAARSAEFAAQSANFRARQGQAAEQLFTGS